GGILALNGARAAGCAGECRLKRRRKLGELRLNFCATRATRHAKSVIPGTWTSDWPVPGASARDRRAPRAQPIVRKPQVEDVAQARRARFSPSKPRRFAPSPAVSGGPFERVHAGHLSP